jgi:cobalt-zinc-cadmium resistance protein CzcA
MFTKLVEFALTQRMLVAALTLLLIGVGISSFRDLPIDAFPDVSPTQVKIIMKAPGMTPEEVEARIVARHPQPGHPALHLKIFDCRHHHQF